MCGHLTVFAGKQIQTALVILKVVFLSDLDY